MAEHNKTHDEVGVLLSSSTSNSELTSTLSSSTVRGLNGDTITSTTTHSIDPAGHRFSTYTTDTLHMTDKGPVHQREVVSVGADGRITDSLSSIKTELSKDGKETHEKTMTVSKVVGPNEHMPNLEGALKISEASAGMDPRLAQNGITTIASHSFASPQADGHAHKDTFTAVVTPDGLEHLSREVSDVKPQMRDGLQFVQERNFHSDSDGRFSESGSMTAQQRTPSGDIQQTRSEHSSGATYQVSEAGRDRTAESYLKGFSSHMENFPQNTPPSTVGMAPHVESSLQSFLHEKGFSPKDASEILSAVSSTVGAAIDEHKRGAGGVLEFHTSGPVAVSMSSGHAHPQQPGVASVSMDRLKDVHESGHVQNLVNERQTGNVQVAQAPVPQAAHEMTMTR